MAADVLKTNYDSSFRDLRLAHELRRERAPRNAKKKKKLEVGRRERRANRGSNEFLNSVKKKL